MGKQKKVSFLTNGRKLKATKLELVHTNLWGPSPIASLEGFRYYITFIDDSSRKIWIYFLKNKSYVFNTFEIWKARVEIETNLKLKCLRSDMVANTLIGDSRSIVLLIVLGWRRQFLKHHNRMVLWNV